MQIGIWVAVGNVTYKLELSRTPVRASRNTLIVYVISFNLPGTLMSNFYYYFTFNLFLLLLLLLLIIIIIINIIFTIYFTKLLFYFYFITILL